MEIDRKIEIWIGIFDYLSKWCTSHFLDQISISVEQRQRGAILISCHIEPLLGRFYCHEEIAGIVEEPERFRGFREVNVRDQIRRLRVRVEKLRNIFAIIIPSY